METIVVPVDDSLDPTRALRMAFSLAKRMGSAVRLISSLENGETQDVEELLSEAASRFDAVAPCSTQVLEGPPVDAVLDSAPAGQSMVCMPTHGRGGVSRLLFGSVAEELIRRSTQPILCVGPEVTNVFLPDERIEGLVCTDDSLASDAVLENAAWFASVIDASCVVTQVVGPDEDIAYGTEVSPRPIRDRASRHCREAAQRLTESGVPATAMVLHGEAASSIVQHADRRSSAFIAVGTSGRIGLARYTLGSVAAGVVRHAPCPVLVVPTLQQSP